MTWREGNSLAAAAALLAVALAGTLLYGSESAPAGSDGTGTAGTTVAKTEKPAELTPEQKRTYAHLLAKWWMPTLLLIIIFIVVLMVVTRALRMWILGRSKPVKFNPVEDVWSQAKDVKRTGKKKKRAR
jgi:hypothetical protein